jgi:hypothetical protein
VASDSTEQQATLLSRLTLDYSPDEDRMKLTGLTQEGALVVAWLSLRLLERLVPHLLSRYEAIVASMGSNTASLPETKPSTMLDGSEAPVLPQHDTPSFLVGSADMAQGPDAIVLTLRGADDDVRFAIPVSKMAHWLSGLRRLYQLAEWPMISWQGADSNLLTSASVGSVTLH